MLNESFAGPVMNEPAPRRIKTVPPAPPPQPLGGSLDLENVNPLQLAVLERARAAEKRGHWLPEITRAQWVLSAVVAVIIVAAIFKVVDGGLTAFQKFTEVYAKGNGNEPAPAAEAPPVDLTAPLAIILVPENSAAPSPAPAATD